MKTHTITDELLRELHSEADLPLREKIEKEVPALFEPKVEENVWYKNSDFSNLAFCKDKERDQDKSKLHTTFASGYGFTFNEVDNQKWVDELYFADSRTFYPATDEEVKAALIGECERRGIWNVPIFDYNGREPKSKCYIPVFGSNELWTEYGCVFKDGKFATPIPQPAQKTTQEVADAFVTYLEDFKTNFLNKLKNE